MLLFMLFEGGFKISQGKGGGGEGQKTSEQFLFRIQGILLINVSKTKLALKQIESTT